MRERTANAHAIRIAGGPDGVQCTQIGNMALQQDRK